MPTHTRMPSRRIAGKSDSCNGANVFCNMGGVQECRLKEMDKEKAAAEKSSVGYNNPLEPTSPVTDTSGSLHHFNFDTFNMDPAPNPYGDIVKAGKLPIKEYVVRERSFIKRELLLEQLQKGPDGKPWPWK